MVAKTSALLCVGAILALETIQTSLGSFEENRLLATLFRGYQPLIRPVQNASAPALEVKMGLQLVLLINVDERNQIMHVNVWLTLVWEDFQMRWKPLDFNNIDKIMVPPDKVWLPDIVLFNNADGNYEVTFHSNVVIKHTGAMLWVPPAIYKSSCIIDVEHFPFDEQECAMNFGSWTFNNEEVELAFNNAFEAVDVSQFYTSTIWDIIDCPAKLNGRGDRIDYTLILRRKALFYTVVLIIPTVLMAILSMMVFYLPADAGEKITLAISILLSLVVFLLLVSKILPATSHTIPLMAKYLLLTFVLNVSTILVTVIIINIYYRGPSTHKMPRWVKWLFLDLLATLLLMRRPKRLRPVLNILKEDHSTTKSLPEIESETENLTVRNADMTAGISGGQRSLQHHPGCPYSTGITKTGLGGILVRTNSAAEADQNLLLQERTSVIPGLSSDSIKAVKAIEYITDHLRQDGELRKYREDWKYVAMVIDRLLFYVYFGITLGGTLGILFSAPNIFAKVNQQVIIERLTHKYDPSVN